MKTSPWLTFQRNKREGWYEFQLMAEPFWGGIIRKQWPSAFHQTHRKGKHKWAVWLDGTPAPIFYGSLNEAKRFVKLMWESLRTLY